MFASQLPPDFVLADPVHPDEAPDIGDPRPMTFPDDYDFSVVDERIATLRITDFYDFRELMWYLIYCDPLIKDVEKARAIYRWIVINNMNNIKFDICPDSSPEQIFNIYKEGKIESMPRIFQLLCCFAGIHCQTVVGYSKGISYIPNEKIEDQQHNHTWNLVYSEMFGGWRMCDTLWGKCYVRLNNGHDQNQFRDVVYEPDNYYFLLKPNAAIYSHLPADSKWQLMPKKQLITLKDFMIMPMIRPQFIQTNMTILGNSNKCVISANEGRAKFSFGYNNLCDFRISNEYILPNGSFASVFNEKQVQKYVLLERLDQRIDVYVRMPTNGRFLVTIYSKMFCDCNETSKADHSSVMRAACIYLIYSVNVTEEPVPFPTEVIGHCWPMMFQRLINVLEPKKGLIEMADQNIMLVRMAFDVEKSGKIEMNGRLLGLEYVSRTDVVLRHKFNNNQLAYVFDAEMEPGFTGLFLVEIYARGETEFVEGPCLESSFICVSKILINRTKSRADLIEEMCCHDWAKIELIEFLNIPNPYSGEFIWAEDEESIQNLNTGPKAPPEFKPKIAAPFEGCEICSSSLPSSDFNQLLQWKSSSHDSSVDEDTIKITKRTQTNFTDLIWQLVYARELTTDSEIIRAIFLWLVSKNLNELDFVDPQPRSPEETLMKLKNREATYAEVFAILCQYANIKCKVINGYAKGVEFVPGMKLNNNTHAMHSWNAALVDGRWHLFDCHWAARRLVGLQPTLDQIFYNVDDFYYMPNPNQLKYTHHPHEECWQLTAAPLSLEEFERYCPVKSSYFKNELELISHTDGFLEHNVSRPLLIQVGFSNLHPVYFTNSFRYEILGEIFKTDDMITYSIHYNDLNLPGLHSFELRFPRNGIYSLMLYVREKNSETFCIFAEYRIQVVVSKSEKTKSTIMSFPPTQQNQYGSTEVAEEIGLDVVFGYEYIHKIADDSKQLDIILASKNENGDLPPFVCQMRGMNIEEEHLSHYVLQRLAFLEPDGVPQLIITPFFPVKGEFALELYAGSDSDNYRLVYQWLLQNEKSLDYGPLPMLPGNILGPLPEFRSSGLSLITPLDPLVFVHNSISKDLKLDSEIKIKLPPLSPAGFPTIRLIAQLTTISSEGEEISLTEYLLQQVEGSELKLFLRFPYRGLFKLHLYGHTLPDMSDTLPVLASYLFVVESNRMFGSIFGPYPKQSNKWKEGAHLNAPLNGCLKSGDIKKDRKLAFSIVVPRAKDVVVVLNEDEVCHLEASLPFETNSVWTGEILLPEGVTNKISVAGRWTSAIGNYPTLLEYRLEED